MPEKKPLVRRRFLVLAVGVPFVLLSAGLAFTTCMPGSSRPDRDVTPSADDPERAAELRRDVEQLATTIGERNVTHPTALAAARDHIEAEFAKAGLTSSRETFSVSGVACSNIIAEIPGTTHPREIVVVGAHYDSVVGSPGANDNATGTATLLALARRFARAQSARTLRFIAFVNEEPPWFQTDDMGSRVNAKASRARGDDIVAMISLETLGCYSDADGSQRYPLPILELAYPSRGDFVAFVGNLSSRTLVRESIRTFRRSNTLASEGAALPEFVSGVGWSDHESFWREGYPAFMVTDTAVYRDANYHTRGDVPDAIHYANLARVVLGLESVVAQLARSSARD
ncbi:MAG: M28 family peptidase [Planctomycetes bacterium]|nr:M28 family peptidase [Planctomycetota bacterium]